MTCLIGEVLNGPGMKSHTSMLGTFFVYTLALCSMYANFREKIFAKISGKKFQTFHSENDYRLGSRAEKPSLAEPTPWGSARLSFTRAARLKIGFDFFKNLRIYETNLPKNCQIWLFFVYTIFVNFIWYSNGSKIHCKFSIAYGFFINFVLFTT